MTEEQALFVPDGGGFVATAHTRGSWHADAQAGGAVLALLGHVLEDVPTDTPRSLSRLTVDFVRPVPVGQRLRIDQTVVRDGRLIQVVDAVVRCGEVEHVRARALRIRDADLTDGGPVPTSTNDGLTVADLPAPGDLESVEDAPGVADFLRSGMELRRSAAGTLPDGSRCAWVRLRVPVVIGSPVRPTSRVTSPMDCVNLIGVDGLPGGITAINPDVSAHVMRRPVGEWTALVGSTRFAAGVGHGFSTARLVDTDGEFGITSTSQVVQRVR